MNRCVAQAREVPQHLLGPLRDSTATQSDGLALRQRLAEEGYLFLRGVVPRDEIMSARQEVFERLAEVGEIAPPAIEGIATGHSRRRESAGDLGAFWQSVSEEPALRHVSHGPRLHDFITHVLAAAPPPHAHTLLPPAAPYNYRAPSVEAIG